MIRLTAFAFAKHLHFAKDAKDSGIWDSTGTRDTLLSSCPAAPVRVRCGRAAAAVRWRCDGNCAQSAVLCCESLSSSAVQDQDGGCLLAQRRSSGQGAVLIGIHIPQLRSSQAQDKIQMLKVDTRG